MKNTLLFVIILTSLIVMFSSSAMAADPCGKDRKFFGLPTWYRYLKVEPPNCDIEIKEKIANKDGVVNERVTFKQIWLIALALIEILITLAGLIAVAFVITGGFKYVVARGNPDKIVQARQTILNSLVGVVIAIIATQVVSYIAGKFANNTNAIGLPTTQATTETLVSIFNVVLAILGSVTVLVIVISGLDFMFSQGEPDKIARARNTIIYALIGMVVIIFAAVIVNFVIGAIG